jgi:glycosyltransferase involved in cell wall biosynthesis
VRIALVHEAKPVFIGDSDRQAIADFLQRGDVREVSSAPKTLGRELVRQGLATEFRQWRFWDQPTTEFSCPGLPPLKVFQCRDQYNLVGLERQIHEVGEPDLIWVEGCKHRPFLARIFELCPHSRKIVYSKEWRPWMVKRLDCYDLCLVDEDWQVEEMRLRHPGVRCAVWDKLMDYEHQHYPVAVEKTFDICYVAFFSPRKNHELLLRAMAKHSERNLTCVLVGGDTKGFRPEVENLAAQLRVNVHFTGVVPKEEVNQYINQSRIGVICSERDAVPRALLEYMAAGVPVLVNANLRAGTRYVGPKAGLVRTPEDFHFGIAELLDNIERFSPREHLLEHFSRRKAVAKFMSVLEQAGGFKNSKVGLKPEPADV